RLVHGASALGQHAGPGDGEPVGLEACVAHEVEVFGPAVEMIVGEGAGATAPDVAGGGRERVPDGGAAAIGLAALDLVGRGGGAEGEIGAEITAIDAEHDGSSLALLVALLAAISIVDGHQIDSTASMKSISELAATHIGVTPAVVQAERSPGWAAR